MTTASTDPFDILTASLIALGKAKGEPAALGVLTAAEEKIKEALKSVKAAGGLTMELAGELKALGEGLIKLATPPAPEPEKPADGGAPPAGDTTKNAGKDPKKDGTMKSLSAAQFVAFAKIETAKALAEPKPELATARLAGLAKAVQVAKESYANSPGAMLPMPKIEEAYRGATGGTAMDLTTSADQAMTETPLTSMPQQGGTNQYAVNPDAGNTQNPMKPNATNLTLATQPGNSQFAVNPDVAKSAQAALDGLAKQLGVQTEGGGFSWPTDLAKRDKSAGKPAPVEKGAGDDGWGRDPWGQ